MVFLKRMFGLETEKDRKYPELNEFDFYYEKYKDKIKFISKPWRDGVNYEFLIKINTKNFKENTIYQIRQLGHIKEPKLEKLEEYKYEYVKLCKRELE